MQPTTKRALSGIYQKLPMYSRDRHLHEQSCLFGMIWPYTAGHSSFSLHPFNAGRVLPLAIGHHLRSLVRHHLIGRHSIWSV